MNCICSTYEWKPEDYTREHHPECEETIKRTFADVVKGLAPLVYFRFEPTDDPLEFDTDSVTLSGQMIKRIAKPPLPD